MPNNLKTLFEKFLKNLKNGEKNPTTINNYNFYLNRFLGITRISKPRDINPETIRSYKLKLNKIKNKQGKFLSPATQNYHLIALRAFLKYLNQEKLNDLNYKKIILFPHKIKKGESPGKAEIEKILEVPLKTNVSDIIKKRDKAILELLFSSGLKVSALVKLKRSEITKIDSSHQARYWIKEYLKKRKDNSEFLFIRHDRASRLKTINPLTTRSIQRIIQGYTKKAGINKKITPESFRKTQIL